MLSKSLRASQLLSATNSWQDSRGSQVLSTENIWEVNVAADPKDLCPPLPRAANVQGVSSEGYAGVSLGSFWAANGHDQGVNGPVVRSLGVNGLCRGACGL